MLEARWLITKKGYFCLCYMMGWLQVGPSPTPSSISRSLLIPGLRIRKLSHVRCTSLTTDTKEQERWWKLGMLCWDMTSVHLLPCPRPGEPGWGEGMIGSLGGKPQAVRARGWALNSGAFPGRVGMSVIGDYGLNFTLNLTD